MARQYFLSIVSACCVLGAFAPYHMSWLAWIGLGLFFLCLRNTASLKHSIGVSMLFGMVLIGGYHSWIFTLDVFGPWWGIFGLWLLYSIYLAMAYGLFGLLSYRLRQTQGSTYALGMAALFALCESCRLLGPIGSPGGIIGYSQIKTLIGPLISLTGVSGLSFMTALFTATLLALTNYKKNTSPPYVAIGVLFWGCCMAYIIDIPPTNTHITISCIQGNQPQHMKIKHENLIETQLFYLTQTYKAIQNGAQVIVWPETILPTDATKNTWFLSALQKSLARDSVVFWGTPVYQSPFFYNSIVMSTAENPLFSVYRKHRLVPFGEYWPFKTWFHRLGLSAIIPGAEYQAGPQPTHPFPNHMSAAICLESVYGNHFQKAVQHGSKGFIISANHAWYGKSSAAEKHLDILKGIAMSYQRGIALATTSGISAVILPNGDLAARAKTHQEDLIMASFPMYTHLTPYAKYGEWFLWVLITVTCSIFAKIYRHRN